MEDDVWECYDYEPFVINVSDILRNGKETLSYSLEFSPSDEIFENINKKLEQQKYIANGDGWADYILKKIDENKVDFADGVDNDSDSETFELYTSNEADFKLLLQQVSLYFQELLANNTKEEIERTISVSRFWSQTDEEDDIDKPEILFNRPRIDYRVSEYIWGFIEKNLLVPKNVLQKNSLNITLYIKPISAKHKFFYGSEYDTETLKFHPSMRGNKLKSISISCKYNGFTEKMTPTEYANVIYDMYCSMLVDNFKKITKKECDELKAKMDFNVINSFEFPASFDNQKYSGDQVGYGGRTINFVTDPKAIPYNYREVYLKQYGQ